MIEELYKQLGVETPPRQVQHQDGTTSLNGFQQPTGLPYSGDVDSLFANTKSHVVLKKERPEHRIMLWMRLQGHRPREIATAMRCTYQTVLNVCGQPWFKEAFVRLSTELGKDAAETFLRGEEIPTLQTLIELRDDATVESVRLSAANSILDRIRGKPTVRVETKTSASVDVTVADVSALLAERERNEKHLRANGILQGGN